MHVPRRSLRRIAPGAATALLITGLLAAGPGPSPSTVAQDIPTPGGRIAYIEDRVRIRTIAGDGTDDQVVFGLTPEATSGIQAVAWRPDGERLAFASGHEEACSIWLADLYLMDADGTDLSRLTNGPSCASQASLPTGTVRVTIANTLAEAREFLLRAQGLDAAVGVIVEPGFQSTFELQVHDLGPDTPQFVVVSDATATWFDPAVYADVQAGGIADAGVLSLGSDVLDTWGALSVSWSHDGTRLAYQQGLGSLWQIAADAGPLQVGSTLFAADVNGSISATTPAWSPVDDRVLYQRYDTSPSTIDLGRADAERVGDPVMAAALVNGIDWLPDGSGFIASDSTSDLLDGANLFQADLRTGSVTQVTGYDTGHALWPTVSPDGLFVAYSYSAVPLEEATALELHVRHLASGVDAIIAANGINADWGP